MMPPLVTKSEAEAFRARWQKVNAIEAEELRSTPIDVKWQQLCTLMRWAREFGWAEALAEGEEEVRQRWIRLRKAHRG